VPDASHFLLFLVAALLLAATPGPGMLYVAARTLAGGRRVGLASSAGTALGGLIHVAAVALGLSALVMASAQAFTAVKLIGAAYLVWLGLATLRAAARETPIVIAPAGVGRAFRDGLVVEGLNPKTAAFFLALLPQFVDGARGDVAAPLLLLGAVSVALNTGADLVVVGLAARARAVLTGRPRMMCWLRRGAGAIMCALGLSLALARRPA